MLGTDDLQSAGVFGLVSAIESFDPQRGAKFTTFASLRVKGAIIDALRQCEKTSTKLERKSIAKTDEAREQLCHALGRQPNDEELREHMEAVGRVAKFRRETRQFSQLGEAGPESPSIARTIVGNAKWADDGRQAAANRLSQIVRDAGVPLEQAAMMYLFHVCKLPLPFIAEITGLAVNRVQLLQMRGYRVIRDRLTFEEAKR
jgi:RNA polymerase sigma factor for flagellar operon FliA